MVLWSTSMSATRPCSRRCGGQLSDARYGHRMRGEGELAELVSRFFRIAVEYRRRHGPDRPAPPLSVHRFHRQGEDQLELFGEG